MIQLFFKANLRELSVFCGCTKCFSGNMLGLLKKNVQSGWNGQSRVNLNETGEKLDVVDSSRYQSCL